MYFDELLRQASSDHSLLFSMSSLSDADVEILKQIGRDTVKNIVSLVVEAVLWSEYSR